MHRYVCIHNITLVKECIDTLEQHRILHYKYNEYLLIS